MAYRRRTLRAMLPITRKVARLVGELNSIDRRLKHLIPELQKLEGEAIALQNTLSKPKDIQPEVHPKAH